MQNVVVCFCELSNVQMSEMRHSFTQVQTLFEISRPQTQPHLTWKQQLLLSVLPKLQTTTSAQCSVCVNDLIFQFM